MARGAFGHVEKTRILAVGGALPPDTQRNP